MVSIIIPTIRPEIAKKCVDAIKLNAGVSEDQYELLVEIDTERIGVTKMVKNMVANSDGQLVMFLGEDTIPQADFLKEALLSMEQLPDKWGLVALNDGMHLEPHGFRQCKLACHWLADKRILPLLDGEFFHTGYIHTACDNELTERCYNLGRYIFSEKSIIRHEKVKGKNFNKDVYKKNQRIDKLLLDHRRSNNWKTNYDTKNNSSGVDRR
jgi:hypothetical protein